jgi:HSP20 family protein
MSQHTVFAKIGHMQADLDRLWRSMLPGQPLVIRESCRWSPPTDVYADEGEVVVKVEVAGMTEDDFRLAYEDGLLTIGGVRRGPTGSTRRSWQRMEIPYGRFLTEAHIPWDIDSERIRATYQDGFLTVRLPIIVS